MCRGSDYGRPKAGVSGSNCLQNGPWRHRVAEALRWSRFGVMLRPLQTRLKCAGRLTVSCADKPELQVRQEESNAC